jgi:peptidoglycan/LPS O-acetylase OafA/YrhL
MTNMPPAIVLPSRNGSRLELIEVARGCAASVVVLYHCARHLNADTSLPWLMAVVQFGHAGVDLFFVISGFIITHVHLGDIGKPARLGHYLRRRFQRVYPLYWIATALTLLIILVRHTLPDLNTLLDSALLAPFAPNLVVGVAWTLQFEIVFYLTFGLCILHRRIGLSAVTLWVLVIMAGLTGIRISPIPALLASPFNLEFLFGVIGAVLAQRRPDAIPNGLLPLGVALFALAALAENTGLIDGYTDPARFAYGLPSAMIVLGAARQPGQWTAWPILRSLGKASYSIYLFQFIFIALMWQFWLLIDHERGLPIWLAFPTLAITAIAGGIVVSRSCEYPLLRLLRRNSG